MTMPDQAVPPRRRCGAHDVDARLRASDPAYAEAQEALEEATGRRGPMDQRPGCRQLTVVVHVVHRTEEENLSAEQVQSQVDVLNRDFRATNPDREETPEPFQDLVADAHVTFVLATTDPDGNPTDGITRTHTDQETFSSDTDAVKSSATGGADPWPSDRYLNLWTCAGLQSDAGDALLGYAQFPGGPAETDGVVILHSAFGTTGTAAAPFDLGRTSTHEIGHWLNLRHIWGDDGTGCSGTDFVDDTPNCAGPNYGRPVFPTVTCDNGPDGDLFVNYMDYTDDAGMVMFTGGQVVRMQAALDGPRSSLATDVDCD
jgi:hypothetical protein